MLFGNRDTEFANSITPQAALDKGASYWPVLLTILLGVAAFIFWARMTEIERITSGAGRVVPSSQIQVVQTFEGGILGSLHVDEGDLVEKGQLLARIDDTGFSSKLGELEEKEAALLAERSRLAAEARQESEIRFPDGLSERNPVTVAAESQLFDTRKVQISAEVKLLEYRLEQRRFELTELRAQEQKFEATLVPLKKEAKMTADMAAKGIAPEVDSLRLQSRVAELEGELAIVRAAMPRVEATIREAEELIVSTRNSYVLSARQRLTALEAELAVVEESLLAASDRVTRTQLRAPVRGVVNRISVNTTGAVVQPGINIVEIVPIDDTLLIEARVRPQDVAFLQPNAETSVKLTAYDYLIYGDLRGKVERISADTLVDPEGGQYYQVMVRTDRNAIGNGGENHPIIPGMTARIDIRTGSNTVLSYLLKPVLRARRESLRER
jgi:membrane fusion protein, adhesin transport system